MNEIRKLLYKNDKYSFGGAILFGLIAHGFMFANKLSFHDDIGYLFSLGQTFEIGRWFLGLINIFLRDSIGRYSMPWLIGILSLFFIALSAHLVADLLEIKSIWGEILVGGLMAVFPVVADTYLYMFTAGAYFLALMMMVFSLWLTERLKYGFVGGLILYICALGIYQAYLGVWLGIAVCILLKKCLKKDYSFLNLIKQIFKYAGISIAGLVLYLGCSQIFMFLFHVSSTTYQGFNELESIRLQDILSGAVRGWLTFFSMAFRDVLGISNSSIVRAVVILCLLISFVCLLANCRKNCSDIRTAGVTFLLFLLFPMCVNIIYAICVTDNATIHTLMLYPLILLFLFPIFLCEQLSDNVHKRWMKRILFMALTVALVYYIHYDNETYLKVSLLQEQTTSYYNVMISRIKGCQGYQDSMPVSFIGEGNIEDDTLTQMERFENITMVPASWDMEEWINNYNYIAYMAHHCGFSPEVVKIENNSKIMEMPCYPDDGSIQVIDNVVVVKLGNV